MKTEMKQRWRLSLLTTALMLVSLGCAQTPPSKYYVLTGLKTAQIPIAQTGGVTLGIGPIKLPGRLDRAQLLTRSGPSLVKIHEYHRWGDSLQRQVEEMLVHNLSAILKTSQVVMYPWEHALRPKYQVLITVRKFEGDLKSGTTLDVIWKLIDVDQDQLKLSRHYVVQTISSKRTMGAYIQSQSQALIQLSHKIAEGLSEIER